MAIRTIVAGTILVLTACFSVAEAKELKLSAFIADEANAAAGGSNPLSEAEARVDAVWDKLPLKVQRALFVSEKAPLYGAYTERSNTAFKAGETLLTYIEPIGYRYATGADGFMKFGVSLDFEILEPDGTVAAGKKDFVTFSTASRAKVKELMMNASLDLHGAPAGYYVLHYIIHDLNSSETAEASLPFSIVN